MKARVLDQILRDRRDKRPVVRVTTLPGVYDGGRPPMPPGPAGEERLVYPHDPAPEGVEAAVFEAARTAAFRDECVTVEAGGATIFCQPHNPPLRLIIVGAVHVAQPLAAMAAIAGFEITVVDPRAAFATEERFPGVRRLDLWPDKALAEIAPDRRTAVVTLTHDPKLDDPAIEAALRSEAFYIGCLGSTKTHAARISRLTDRGHSQADLARLFGPVGLRIGARSPAEIAVSILAQIIEQLRKGF